MYGETLNYIVTMVDKSESPFEITNSTAPQQKYGFLYFNDEAGELIIAIRVDTIASFAPTSRQIKPQPGVHRTVQPR
jgi:hypothetical protein